MTKNFYEVRRLFWVFCNFVCFCDLNCWVWDKNNSDRFFKFHRQVLNYCIIPASSRFGPLSCIGAFYQEVFTCNLCIKIRTRLPFYKRYKKNCTCDDLINTFSRNKITIQNVHFKKWINVILIDDITAVIILIICHWSVNNSLFLKYLYI